ncbi:unconventional myosin-Vb-like protein, partial [Columba guinea]
DPLSPMSPQGARVWIPDSVDVWRVAEITRGYKEGDTVLHLRLEDGSALAYPIESQLPHLCNPDCLSGADDLVALSHLHEPAVLHSLRRRFLEANAIYTYCGIILVAINPYKPLPIYEEEVIYAYSGREMGDMDPHIFALAEEAYKQMVSGESGAGKTASAKYAMRYFTTVGGCLGDSSMEEKVLASSPLMEAFGNAKTARNDNSSRFGKYIEIGFSQARVTGATIKTYLLEKSRVTFQAKAERNYHIFYQLCTSATLPELQGLGLRECPRVPLVSQLAAGLSHAGQCQALLPSSRVLEEVLLLVGTPGWDVGGAESFHYTCQGQDTAARSTSDAADLENTRHAFLLLGTVLAGHRPAWVGGAWEVPHAWVVTAGVPEDEQLELYSILAAILHLGNIVVRARDRRGDGCFVEPDDEALEMFCSLLGVEVSQVTRWLCHRKLVTAGETYLKSLSRQQALDSRDALAKHMFEMFELNSFEQFCINYANEKLQQLFNLNIFKLEQEEYATEEIPWVFIDFCDNQTCIELIEGRLGILDLLNEECKVGKQCWDQAAMATQSPPSDPFAFQMPQGSDGSWAQKLYQTHLSSSHFQKPKRPTDAFIVCHFAGKVEYQCGGFVEKNRDAVPEELVGLLRASKSALLAELFLEEGDGAVSRRSSGPRMTGRSSRRSLPSNQKSKKSISSQFKASLKRLMEMLSSTTQHYVRCIKPNDGKQPFVFDSRRAVEQLRACGVLETIRISALGYPSRCTYQEFLERYRALVSREELRSTNKKQICSLALERLLQKTLRMVLARRSYLRLRQATLTIQAFARGLFARRLYQQMVQQQKAVVIQAAVRGWLARSRYGRLRGAVVYLQCCYRRARARRELRRLRLEARSVEHYKQLHRGMEIKVIQLQCRLDEQAQEKQRLVEQLSGLNAAHAEEVQRLQAEVQRLREEVARDSQVQQLQERLAELERLSMKSCLSQEVEELRQRLAEVEATKLQLGQEKDAVIRRMLEQSQDLEEQQQRAARESWGLRQELEEERARYQSLVQEYTRLEQGYENLRDEVAFHRQSTLRRSPSSESFLGSDSSYMSLSTAPSRDGSDQQAEVSGDIGGDSELVTEGPEPSGEALLNGSVGQDPIGKAYRLLLGQLSAVNEELARTREELRRSKAPVEPEERKPLEFLKRRNIAELLGLGRSPEKVAVDDDLKHAYDAVQVANRLLASQLREEKQQHEEEVEGLHLDICSLKQLSQQQAALIQDLQRHQGQDGLQTHVLRLREENWELAQKLEKQERTMLKLQKQLKAYAKQIQELTGKCSHGREVWDWLEVKREATGPAQELATSALVPSQSPMVPSLAGTSQAMLAWRMEDAGRIIKAIITDYKPQSSPGELPDLPAYILFLCFRHADHCGDEPRAHALLDAAIDAIKRVMKKHSDDFDVVALWLANTCRLQNCLRQYSQDESYWQGNTARQNEHRLQNVDPQSCCRSLGALAVQLYQQLIRTAEKRLKPMIVAAMLESEPIQGLSSSCPPGRRRSSAAPAHTLPELLQQLGSFRAALDRHGLAPAVGHQVLRQLLFLVSGTTLNYLLLRKDTCSWSRGIQLRYNISQLEQWLRVQGLQQSGAQQVLEPLVQAAQLLQVKKVTKEDAGALCSLCTVLSPQQVVKILRAYTPTVGLEERISPSFISSVEEQLQEQYGGGPGQLLVDTSHLFPVHLPFAASPLRLDELHIPAALNLPFLVRL